VNDKSEWRPWLAREWGTIKVAQRQWADAFGSAYLFARNKRGGFKRFFTRKGAQEYADKLNAELSANEVSRG
jgi:hypothetical protein